MTVYQIVHKNYANDIEGIGAKLFAGRWNTFDYPCIYTSGSLSLAVLERFAHHVAATNFADLALKKIEIPDEEEIIIKIDVTKLAKNWIDDIDYCQWLGCQILADTNILGFSVPSALIKEEQNIIINPQSRHFKKIIFSEAEDIVENYGLLSKLI